MTTPASLGGTPDQPPQAPSDSHGSTGAVIGGRYTLHELIGSGGMGAVWHAWDDLLRRDVAIKEVLLPPGIPADERAALYERTLREARAAASLSHPSVVRMYDVVQDADRPWLVMELLQARSIADMITRNGPLPPRAVAKIGLSVLGALEAAHSAGVLHRDVKPANVLICSDGRCVLTDFGVARIMTDQNAALTTPGMVLGSPQYISPERAMGADFGPPSDLFSLGVTLYTAAQGTPPFDRGDPLSTMHAVVYEDPEPPRNAGPLAPVLLGLLVKDPAQRWDVDRTRSELRAALAGPLAPGARPAPGGYAAGTPMSGPPGPAPMSPGPVAPAPAAGAPMPPAPAGGPMPPGPMSGAPAPGVPGPMSGAPAPGMAGPMSGAPAPGMAGPMSGAPAPGVPGPMSGPPASGGPANPMRATAAVPQRYPEPGYGDGYGQPHAPSRQLRHLGPWLVGAGAAIVVIILVVVALGAGGAFSPDEPDANPTTPAAEAGGPTKAVQDPAGFHTAVPKGWQQIQAEPRKYSAPGDRNEWIMFQASRDGGNPTAFLRGAAHGLKVGKKWKNYHQISLHGGLRLGGRAATELEYTLTANGQERHGLWRVAAVDGHLYEVYLSVPQSSFAKDKQVYQQAVKNYRFN
ncbi:serine/threonine-protein kinase [Actinocatenispora sera]|uniref:non-specific serine/threonine protein kinase n=1 Tax=Actinocatenispora sera TaxID=390989 RepID=A0A810KTZ9_9ACTN|nr:serine/threonine-protein kinase [Actinocatenispora sera]BCJ25932.1 hypothetical protein Asera_00400 [Actinocatenispora sera]